MPPSGTSADPQDLKLSQPAIAALERLCRGETLTLRRQAFRGFRRDPWECWFGDLTEPHPVPTGACRALRDAGLMEVDDSGFAAAEAKEPGSGRAYGTATSRGR